MVCDIIVACDITVILTVACDITVIVLWPVVILSNGYVLLVFVDTVLAGQ